MWEILAIFAAFLIFACAVIFFWSLATPKAPKGERPAALRDTGASVKFQEPTDPT